jgi:DNA-binding CsgD family transcriptional regulator
MTEPEVVIAALGCLTPREAEAVLWIAQGKTSWRPAASWA